VWFQWRNETHKAVTAIESQKGTIPLTTQREKKKCDVGGGGERDAHPMSSHSMKAQKGKLYVKPNPKGQKQVAVSGDGMYSAWLSGPPPVTHIVVRTVQLTRKQRYD